ncbi:putative toxin [Nocardia flavorosea]|uniref:putative toxin n=1 Tax=Nocardia flavorosea TaxID=53429 RepID=UPI00289E2EF9|nr:putative toxin [Nocardia flavorosea]
MRGFFLPRRTLARAQCPHFAHTPAGRTRRVSPGVNRPGLAGDSGLHQVQDGSKFQPVLDKQLKHPPPRTRADQPRRNKLAGAEAEARAGIDPTKTKESIKSASGTASKRVPDDLDHTNMRLTEVKNVERQALTGQIRDDLAYCEGRSRHLGAGQRVGLQHTDRGPVHETPECWVVGVHHQMK